MSGHIYIDITELKNWDGHLTGVQRLVYNLAKELKEVDDRVLLCSYNPAQNIIQFEDQSYFSQNEKPRNIEAIETSKLKSKLTSIYFKIPAETRQKIPTNTKEAIKRVGRKTIHLTHKTKLALQSKSSKNSINIQEVKLEPNDIILIPGRLWDHQEFINYITGYKEKVGFKLAVVIYDLVPIYQQHTFGPGLTDRYAPYIFQSVYYADLLLPISESTKSDLLRFSNEMGLKVPQVKVIRLGDDNPSAILKQPEIGVDINKGFGICIGTIEARKNHTLIYYAYKLAASEGVELAPTIIIGKPGWLTDNIVYFIEHDSDVKEKIKIISNITDAEISWLYKNALFSVYPSQYEGWGLPIAESLVYGTPVVASNTSSMKEISDLTDLISPFDSRELMERLKYYSNKDNSFKKRQRISKEYSSHSWKSLAKTLSRVLSSIM